jgi:tellurite resistance protein
MSSFWSELRDAFDEGRDEGLHGAPNELLVDAMMLAARADRKVTEDELERVVRLLAGHFKRFAELPAKELFALLHASVLRLDARGEPEAQLATVAAELREHGDFAVEKGYALAYATLLSGGVDEAEGAFAERFRSALGLGARRAREIEVDLETAARLR